MAQRGCISCAIGKDDFVVAGVAVTIFVGIEKFSYFTFSFVRDVP